MKTTKRNTRPRKTGKVVSPKNKREKFWIVEDVVDKRIRNGKIQYKLKWEGYEESENTWEPIEHLNENSADLVCNFEAKLVSTIVKVVLVDESSGSCTDSKYNSNLEVELPQTGYDLGYEAEKIIGLKNYKMSGLALVKWKGMDLAELVPLHMVKTKSPQQLIEYFGTIITPKLVWDGVSPMKDFLLR